MEPNVLNELRNMMMELDYAADELVAIFDYQRSKRWINRQFWIHPTNEGRLYGEGFFLNEFQEMKLYPHKFKRYTRMDLPSFEYLLKLLEPEIAPQTNRASDICAEQRLAMTLRFLATGDQVDSIAGVYKVGEATLYDIINSTCDAIYKILFPKYIRLPSRPIWHNISKGFESNWNLPHCLGAVDGKHIHIEAPPHSGSLFFNYKKSYSIVLMAACNHRYEFTWVNEGSFGGESDAGILSRSDFGRRLEAETLPIPRERTNLPESNIKVPYFFIGDDAFALRKDFMKPYSHRNLTQEQQIFNYRISRARNCIECTFGILTKRWKVLEGRIGIHPNEIDRIVLACVCLHNFLMSRTQSESRNQNNNFNRAQNNNQQHAHVVDENIHNPAVREHFQIRNDLTRYFMSREGQVPWQFDYINRGRNL